MGGCIFLALSCFASVTSAKTTTLSPGDALAEIITAAEDGDVVVLPKGRWQGPITITSSIVLRNEGGVITGNDKGTVVRVDAPRVRLENLQVEYSGDDLRGPDSCIYLTPKSTGSVVIGNELTHCTFGIWIHETHDVELINNRISGKPGAHSTELGNGIQLFDGENLTIRGNYVTKTRDGIYVSATEKSLIENNITEYVRYGIHYMFSYYNTIQGNISEHNKNGYALMESLHLTVRDNIARYNKEHGLLFRDAQYCKIYDNYLESNGEGLFFFSSTNNEIRNNVVKNNTVGAKIWAGSVRNTVSGNHFIGNQRQIFYVSTKDLDWGEEGEGNYWSDYMGWDQDKDGVGERAYRVDSFTSNLIHRFPNAVLLLRSPVLELLGHLQERMPALKVPTVIDHAPLMHPPALNTSAASKKGSPVSLSKEDAS
ncbi:MAG: nitrous oxide reductase family maturation protein NosD [Deltaproteobacteria bacterium]|nr:nitrous oxide reductase family maturation protein NosD [Deltaproteobacteria bacterium]